jgi:7-carboxy-7-deazaguanine synthase
MTSSRPLLVAEVFGPTIQGEGPSTGRRCGFVRLGGCNLDCVWCDTPYTWDWARFQPRQELSLATCDDVVGQVAAMDVDMVVVTGGEPMLQQDRLLPFLAAVNARGWRVEVETNGTIAPSAEMIALVDQFNVSPKLANSAVAPEQRLVDQSLAAYARCGRAVFKFVVEEVADIDEVDAIVARHELRPVYLMPQATDAAGVVAGMRRVADAAAERGYGLSPRLHILLWGNARGR